MRITARENGVVYLYWIMVKQISLVSSSIALISNYYLMA
jgi:hypothetical protein